MKFVEKVTKALIKQQNFSNYYNKTDKPHVPEIGRAHV